MYLVRRVITDLWSKREKIIKLCKSLEEANTVMNATIRADEHLHRQYDTHENYNGSFRAYNRGAYKYGAYDLYIEEV